MTTPIEIHFRKDLLDTPDLFVMVVEFRGEMDESNIDDAATQVYKIIDESPQGASFIFDFEALGYMNSKSIGYLSDWFSKVVEKGGILSITGAKENINDTLTTVGLDNFIKMYHSVDDAKLALLPLGDAGGQI